MGANGCVHAWRSRERGDRGLLVGQFDMGIGLHRQPDIGVPGQRLGGPG